MPERRNVVTYFTELIFGGPWVWNGLIGEIHEIETERSGLTTHDYDAARQVVDDLYLELLDRIDWNRAILEAQGRHARHQKADPEHRWLSSAGDDICPTCLHEALANPEHRPVDEPESTLAKARRRERTSRLRSWARHAKGWRAVPAILASPVHDERYLVPPGDVDA